MKTPLPDAKLEPGRRTTAAPAARSSTQPTGPDAVLVGKVLRMWRARPGKPDTAADVGAKPGSAVFSPVTGTVVKVKKYKLYGKWDDYELHIQPDGYPTLDLVMIHLDGRLVQAGRPRAWRARRASRPCARSRQVLRPARAATPRTAATTCTFRSTTRPTPSTRGSRAPIDPGAESHAGRGRVGYSAPGAFDEPAEAAVELRAHEHHASARTRGTAGRCRRPRARSPTRWRRRGAAS